MKSFPNEHPILFTLITLTGILTGAGVIKKVIDTTKKPAPEPTESAP